MIGSFEALDYFGDGSFYLLNGPGHSIGHICAIARVTVPPDTFVFMGGDSCHHPGVLRPTKYQPCPVDSLHSWSELKSKSLFTLSPALTHDFDAALRTVHNIQELHASDDIFVILAHDNTLRGNVDFYPSTINEWKAKGYDKKTRWLFFRELENLEENSN